MRYFTNKLGKALSMAASVCMIVSLAACGGSAGESSPNAPQPSSGNASAGATVSTDPSGPDTSMGSDAVVVYFSTSGNTKRVGDAIAEALNVPTFELVPEEPYSDADLNWNDPDSRVIREHEDKSLQDIKLANENVPDWNSYQTVYLGFPIWWGAPAWPVNNFVKNNDFTDKTIVPFATSSVSGIDGDSQILQEMAGTGTRMTGHRFSSGSSTDDVIAWLSNTNNGLNE